MKRRLLICAIGVVLLGLGCLGFPGVFKQVREFTRRLAAAHRSSPVPTEWRRVTQSVDGPVPGKPIESLLITVEAKPEIKKLGDSDYLVLPAVEGREIEIAFSPEKDWSKALPRDRELKFTIWQTKLVYSHEVETTDWECKGVLSQTKRVWEHSSWVSEIETIQDGAVILYNARICPLHKTKMERGELEISYGLPRGEFVEFVRKTPFPGFVLGGCCRGPIDKMTGYRCSECVRAYKIWKAEEIEKE